MRHTQRKVSFATTNQPGVLRGGGGACFGEVEAALQVASTVWGNELQIGSGIAGVEVNRMACTRPGLRRPLPLRSQATIGCKWATVPEPHNEKGWRVVCKVDGLASFKDLALRKGEVIAKPFELWKRFIVGDHQDCDHAHHKGDASDGPS